MKENIFVMIKIILSWQVWATVEISRDERLCTPRGLDNIEDKIQFLFYCPNYSSVRDDFYNKKYKRLR